MTRRICTPIFLFILLQCFIGQAQDKPQRWDRGQWSGEATALLTTPPGDWTSGRTQFIPSPDQQKNIQVKDNKVFLEVQGKVFPADFGSKFLAELGWAPDSSRFFLTWSDAGWGGTYHAQVYQVSPAGLKEIRGISKQAKSDFSQRIRRKPPPKQFAEEPGLGYWLALHYCEPNVVGAQWLHGSSELLLSVLVPNTSYCRYSSEFNVYRVAVPGGRILERYTAQEAHQKFDKQNLPRITQ